MEYGETQANLATCIWTERQTERAGKGGRKHILGKSLPDLVRAHMIPDEHQMER